MFGVWIMRYSNHFFDRSADVAAVKRPGDVQTKIPANRAESSAHHFRDCGISAVFSKTEKQVASYGKAPRIAYTQ